MMMAAQEALNSLAMIHHDPEILLGLVNRRLRQIQRRGFVALGWLGVGNGGSSLRYTLAGQPPLLLRRLDGQVIELPLPSWRLPLGSMPQSHHEVIEWDVEPGELIVACSDGVVEAQAPSGQAYGFERLATAIAAAPTEPRAAAAAILADLDQFTQGSDPWDDVTLVVLARSEVHA
jgi:serine phosphatase RsbU (regulator of sigma subunit)